MGDRPTAVAISGAHLALEDVMAVADGAQVALTQDATETIEQSRKVVDESVARGDAIYGVTTGVGHARNERLPENALAAMQPFLVEMHLGAVGERLPVGLVRAGMVARLNGFARGGAGVSLPVARTLEGMLNHGIHPIIPRTGSVGTGDLGQLALLGRAMLGRGEVEWHDGTTTARQALERAGLAPPTLEPKDALAIISSNALTVGHGISLWRDLRTLIDLADLVAATSMESISANPSIIDAAVAQARSSQGQQDTSQNLRDALAGSDRVDPAVASVQDPISFRVVPQVHGAFRDILDGLAAELSKELNAASDNPLVHIETGRILSNGNFHVMGIALSAESTKLALAHVGMLSERRCGQLWDAAVSSIGEITSGGEEQGPPGEGVPPMMAGLSLRYPIAARYTKLRLLAQPVTFDIPTLDLSVEDHATNAAEALWTLDEMIGIVNEILGVELLLAYAGLMTSAGQGDLGARTSELVGRLTDELGHLPPGTLPDETHSRVVNLLTSESTLASGN